MHAPSVVESMFFSKLGQFELKNILFATPYKAADEKYISVKLLLTSG